MSTTPNLTQFVYGSWKIDLLDVEFKVDLNGKQYEKVTSLLAYW